MKIGMGSRIVAAAIIAIAFGAGCGDGSNNNNNDNGGVEPTRTATPARTATPNVGATATPTVVATPAPTATAGQAESKTVTFTTNASVANQGFKLTVTYPTAKGSFHGSADAVQCSTNASGAQFIPNDQDNGTMLLAFAGAVNIPTSIVTTCTFDQEAGQTLVVGDLTATVSQVVVNNTPNGDPSTVAVTIAVN